MKSVSMSHSDSIFGADTACFRSDSLSWLHETELDTFVVCAPKISSLPCTRLAVHRNVAGELVFTVFFLIIFAFIRLRGKDLLYNLSYILIKRKKSEIVLNEGISSNLVCYLLALCLSFSILSVAIHFMAWQSFFSLKTCCLFAGLLLYHFFLIALVRLLGWTFNFKAVADEVTVHVWTYHILSGLAVSLFVIAAFFVKNFAVVPLIRIVVFCLIFFMCIRVFRWIEILFTSRFSILYMFLYLCAFEIMPLLVLYKVVA